MACTKALKAIAAREIDARHRIARQDLATAFAEIFTPRIRGQRRVLEVTRRYREVTVCINGPELDSGDLGVLLALLVIAERDVTDTAPARTRAGLIPASRRGEENAAAVLDSVGVQTSVAEIARMIGRDPRDGRAAQAVRRSLKYLMMVVIEGTRGELWGTTHLVGIVAGRGGWISVSLNYRATKAVMGSGQWAPVDMRRWVGATEVERILMHRLAAHCVGCPLPVSLTRLAATCWTRQPANSHEHARRVRKIAAALPKALPVGVTCMVINGLVTFRDARRTSPFVPAACS